MLFSSQQQSFILFAVVARKQLGLENSISVLPGLLTNAGIKEKYYVKGRNWSRLLQVPLRISHSHTTDYIHLSRYKNLYAFFYIHEVSCLLLYFCIPSWCGNVVKILSGFVICEVFEMLIVKVRQKLRIYSVAEITDFALFNFLWSQMCTHQQSSLDLCWRNLLYCVQNTSAQIHFQWECFSVPQLGVFLLYVTSETQWKLIVIEQRVT